MLCFLYHRVNPVVGFFFAFFLLLWKYGSYLNGSPIRNVDTSSLQSDAGGQRKEGVSMEKPEHTHSSRGGLGGVRKGQSPYSLPPPGSSVPHNAEHLVGSCCGDSFLSRALGLLPCLFYKLDAAQPTPSLAGKWQRTKALLVCSLSPSISTHEWSSDCEQCWAKALRKWSRGKDEFCILYLGPCVWDRKARVLRHKK